MKEKMLSVQNSLIHRIIITFVTPIWDLKGENIRWTTVFHFNSIYFRIPYFKTLKVLAKEWVQPWHSFSVWIGVIMSPLRTH